MVEFTLTPKQEAGTEGIPGELGLHGQHVHHRILSQKKKTKAEWKRGGLSPPSVVLLFGGLWRKSNMWQETTYCASGKAMKVRQVAGISMFSSRVYTDQKASLRGSGERAWCVSTLARGPESTSPTIREKLTSTYKWVPIRRVLLGLGCLARNDSF